MSSTSSATSYLVTPLTFNGQSKYSADFQQILDRAVQVQTIPLAQVEDQITSDQNRLTALNSLDTTLQSLQTAITGLGTAVGQSALSATVSDTSAASVSLSSNAAAGSYQVEVSSLGSYTQTISDAGTTVTDPSSQNISTSSSFTLTVNGTQTAITPSSDTLSGLVSAINQNSASLGVSASMVNVGSSSAPEYQIAIQSTNLANDSIQLNDGSQDLLTTLSTGTPNSYSIDGQSITGNSDTITLAPGVTANLLQTTSGSPITITVAPSTTQASTAMQTFVTSYNAVVTALAAQHGENAGALSGDSLLMVASEALSSINGYTTTSGSVGYLAALGITLNNNGSMTFDSSAFSSSVGSNFTGLSAFLGDSTTGFIGTATQALAMLEDPTVGAAKTEETSLNADVTAQQAKATEITNNVNQFQQNLVDQLAQSDAAIVSLTSQTTLLQGLFNFNTNSSSSS